MKKLLIVAMLLTATFTVKAQFVLTPKGFVDAKDETKDYIVVDVPEKSKAEIYKAVEVYLNTIFNSPKDVLSKVENESITANALFAKAITVKGNWDYMYKTNWDMMATLTLLFKDGKIRVNAPSINSLTYRSPKGLLEVTLNAPGRAIYNKKGALDLPETKAALENQFNTLISKITDAAKAKVASW